MLSTPRFILSMHHSISLKYKSIITRRENSSAILLVYIYIYVYAIEQYFVCAFYFQMKISIEFTFFLF